MAVDLLAEGECKIMARYTGPSCRLCRRSGGKLMLKGERCLTAKCVMEKRSAPPGGQLQRRRPKVSARGTQLREKQKARYTYGVLEKQFRGYFSRAHRVPGMVGSNLIQLLERRLDNVVFRSGFASSRAQARQIVGHGHIFVNGRKVDISSYLVKTGDLITWRERSSKTELYKKIEEDVQGAYAPSWLSVDKQQLASRVLSFPESSEVEAKFDAKMIVEYYSR